MKTICNNKHPIISLLAAMCREKGSPLTQRVTNVLTGKNFYTKRDIAGGNMPVFSLEIF